MTKKPVYPLPWKKPEKKPRAEKPEKCSQCGKTGTDTTLQLCGFGLKKCADCEQLFCNWCFDLTSITHGLCKQCRKKSQQAFADEYLGARGHPRDACEEAVTWLKKHCTNKDGICDLAEAWEKSDRGDWLAYVLYHWVFPRGQGINRRLETICRWTTGGAAPMLPQEDQELTNAWLEKLKAYANAIRKEFPNPWSSEE